MKHLKDYITESILDDDDTIMNNAHAAVFRDYIDKLNDIIKKQNHFMGGEHVEFIEHVLMFKVPSVTITQEMVDIISEFSKFTKFDEIGAEGEIVFGNFTGLLDGKIIKTYRCKSVVIERARSVSDVDFCLENWSTSIKSKFVVQYMNTAITNVNIYMDGKSFGDRMRFLEWPNLKNTYCRGVKSVCIYNPSVFDDDDAKKILNGFIDPTYTYSITDAKKGEVVRKGDLRTLVATVNNPKRYLVDTADDIMFSIRKSAKLKDIIDITKFDKDLEWISISNNGVVINFRRKGVTLNFLQGEPHQNLFMNLPNDPEWEMIVTYRK